MTIKYVINQQKKYISKEIAMNLLEHLIPSPYIFIGQGSVSCIELNQKRKKLDHCELKSKKHQAVWNKG